MDNMPLDNQNFSDHIKQNSKDEKNLQEIPEEQQQQASLQNSTVEQKNKDLKKEEKKEISPNKQPAVEKKQQTNSNQAEGMKNLSEDKTKTNENADLGEAENDGDI